MGRPKLQIDERQVAALASIHCTMKEIAAVVGCSVDTLENRFSDVIKENRERGKMSLRRAQWKAALNGNVTMQIWLGKQWLGQKEPVQQLSEDVTVRSDADQKAKEKLERILTRRAARLRSQGVDADSN